MTGRVGACKNSSRGVSGHSFKITLQILCSFPFFFSIYPQPPSAGHPVMLSGRAIPGELTDSLDIVVMRKENDKIVKGRNYFNL